MMDTLIRRMARFIFRQFASLEGWSMILLFVCMAALGGAFEHARWVRAGPMMHIPALAGVFIGATLSGMAGRAWPAGLLAAGLGVLMGVLTTAKAWPPFSLLAVNLRYGVNLLMRAEDLQPPLIPLDHWLLDRLGQFGEHFQAWLQGIGGNAQSAPQVFSLILYLAVWGAAVWAGWIAFRRRRALLALAPAGVLLGTNVFFSQTGAYWLIVFMFGLALLALRLRQITLEQAWERDDIDYSPEFRLDLYLSGFALALIMTGAMTIIPSVRVRPVEQTFWRVFNQPYDLLESRLKDVFPGLDRSPRSLLSGGARGSGGLPRSHLLGGSPDLAERVVMHVQTSDLDPGNQEIMANYRWRGLAYATYNGRGWENEDDLVTERFNPGETWLHSATPGRRVLRQTFAFEGNAPFWLYAAGEPAAADRPVNAHFWGEQDPVGFDIQARNYTVISQIPAVPTTDLDAASTTFNPSLAPYLTLPETLPGRVSALAHELTASAEAPYAQAAAIESFLRGYAYTLDVPEPPPDVDVADYFLFDLQKGYCDYYATAMVVMARSVGLPARMAVGYAAGAYDAERNEFTVVEADAHSWPEIYFPRYGWIPFEPTAAQPTYVRQAPDPRQIAQTSAEELDLTSELTGLRRWAWLRYGAWRWGLPMFAALALLLLLSALRREWRLRQRAENPWQLAYLRLETWGNRLGIPPAPWYTPREYAERWQTWLTDTQQPDHAAYTIASDIDKLKQALEQSAYAPAGTRPREAMARPLWRHLRSALWRLRLSRYLRKPDPKQSADYTD